LPGEYPGPDQLPRLNPRRKPFHEAIAFLGSGREWISAPPPGNFANLAQMHKGTLPADLVADDPFGHSTVRGSGDPPADIGRSGHRHSIRRVVTAHLSAERSEDRYRDARRHARVNE
jgi:hypothetical protein